MTFDVTGPEIKISDFKFSLVVEGFVVVTFIGVWLSSVYVVRAGLKTNCSVPAMSRAISCGVFKKCSPSFQFLAARNSLALARLLSDNLKPSFGGLLFCDGIS